MHFFEKKTLTPLKLEHATYAATNLSNLLFSILLMELVLSLCDARLNKKYFDNIIKLNNK